MTKKFRTHIDELEELTEKGVITMTERINPELEESIVYVGGNISINFDGYDTFTVYDTILEYDTFHHPDVISMQHARDIAERYVQRVLLGD